MAQAEDILTAAVAGALDNAQISVSLIPLAAYPFGTPGGYQLLSECMDTETMDKNMLISPAQNPKQCPALFIVPPQQSSYWKNQHPKGIKSLSI